MLAHLHLGIRERIAPVQRGKRSDCGNPESANRALAGYNPMVWGAFRSFMLRLTLMLSAAIYAVLVIYSERAPQPGTDAGTQVTRGMMIDATVPGAPARGATSGQLTTADGRILAIAAVIDPVALDDARTAVHLVSTRGAETVVASASAGQPELPLVEVTGASVNLRAGPSTGERVLDALGRGEQVELIASLGNGWAQIRTVETGVEGYMADRFLAPLN
jgi:hypothetical protein